VTLVGGKYTTFRQMAEDATDALLEALGLPKRECSTRSRPYFNETIPTASPSEDPMLWEMLRHRYGPRAGEVYDTCLAASELSKPLIEAYDLRLGELVYSAREEKVERLDDLILRRTRLAWRPELTDELRERIAGVNGTMSRLRPSGSGRNAG
jgi:glycerol-3-phosphate dehydrogenase